MDQQNKSHLENIAKKEIFSEEEKQFILDRLNRERLEKQKFQELVTSYKKQYTDEDKNRILKELNDKRIRDEHNKEMKRIRFLNKEIYKFGNKTFFKLKDME